MAQAADQPWLRALQQLEGVGTGAVAGVDMAAYLNPYMRASPGTSCASTSW